MFMSTNMKQLGFVTHAVVSHMSLILNLTVIGS